MPFLLLCTSLADILIIDGYGHYHAHFFFFCVRNPSFYLSIAALLLSSP